MTRTGEVVVRTMIGATVMFAALAGARVQAAPDDSPKASAASPRATHTTAVVAWKPRAWAPPAAAPVRIERRSNGMLIAHMDERYAEYMMMTIGPDGTPSVTCVHGSQGVASFMKQALVPAAAPSPVREAK